MRFNLFQKVVAFLHTIPSGLIFGYWLKGVTPLPVFWFMLAGLFVTLLVSFIPAHVFSSMQTSLRTHVSNGVAQASPHVQGIPGKIGGGLSKLWNDGILRFKQKPMMWCGVIVSFVALFLFGKAYTQHDWHTFHLALGTSFFAGMLFMQSQDYWKNADEVLNKYPHECWLVISLIFLAVTAGHKWGALAIGIPAISAVCAIISIAKLWELVLRGVKASIAFAFKPFKGDYGNGVMMLCWAAVILVILSSKIMSGAVMNEVPTWFYMSCVGFVFLLIFGTILTGQEQLKKNKK